MFHVADVVTTNCYFMSKQLQKLGCPLDKIHKLNYGLNPDEYPFRERTLKDGEFVRILTVARLVEKKGLEYSIRAVNRVRAKNTELHYDIIGEGPLRSMLEALIHQLGMEDVVTLHGAKEGSFVRQILNKAHIFMLNSVTATNGDLEGTPVSLLEAQACGLPVVSSWHSGIPEVILDGESGFLLPECDVSAISDRLTYLVNNPDRWSEMGRKGRQNIEKQYDTCKLNHCLVDLYKEAIAKYRRRN